MVFAAAAFTDYLDGYLARKRHLVTNFGKFLDPIADKMLTTAAFVGLLAIGQMSAWALMLILVREFVVTSVRLVAAEKGKVVAANGWGKAKTVAQYVAILYMLAVLEVSAAVPQLACVLLTVGQVLLWITAVLTAIAGWVYFWQNRTYFLEDLRGDRQ